MIRDPGVQESPIPISLCGSTDGSAAFPTVASHLNRLKNNGLLYWVLFATLGAGSYEWLLKCFCLYYHPPHKSNSPAL